MASMKEFMVCSISVLGERSGDERMGWILYQFLLFIGLVSVLVRRHSVNPMGHSVSAMDCAWAAWYAACICFEVV